MKTSLIAVRAFFLSLCVLAGYAVSQKYPELIRQPSHPFNSRSHTP